MIEFGRHVRVTQQGREVRVVFYCDSYDKAYQLHDGIAGMLKAGEFSIKLIGLERGDLCSPEPPSRS